MMDKLSGIVKRITFHSPESGWSVLKVDVYGVHEEVAVTVYQCQVFAGATMDFEGEWTVHPKFGRQFRATKVTEKKPASIAALEKYLGSGLIFGVGPVTAKRIVKYFGVNALDVFENKIERLMEVEGIAEKKLKMISEAWQEHRSISKVMLFLQGHGISTLFAVKIFKQYGNDAITTVMDNPYQLANDIFGIGFFSADKIANSLGIVGDNPKRVRAGILHVLASSREAGHCYLIESQIINGVEELLVISVPDLVRSILKELECEESIKVRMFAGQKCYYSKRIFYDEDFVAKKVKKLVSSSVSVDSTRVTNWVTNYCAKNQLTLSEEQKKAVIEITQNKFSILTGGPGCGKTTATKTLVALLLAMRKRVLLAAPTGRAAQRMGEVIGMGVEAKTIHRLLVFDPKSFGGFKKNEKEPLEADFIIIDECSMLDIMLSASLLRAVPVHAQLLFIGDPDQLPSVGAGNVLKDLISAQTIPVMRLTQVFRQAAASKIITYAHQINRGEIPKVDSPLHNSQLWKTGIDCMFIDSDELTQEQISFVSKSKRFIESLEYDEREHTIEQKNKIHKIDLDDEGRIYFDNISEDKTDADNLQLHFVIPQKFNHVDLAKIKESRSEVADLKAVLKKIHPWSSVHFGMNATAMLLKIYKDSVPKYLGKEREIQILTPMTKGSLGTANLNRLLQEESNPAAADKKQMKLGDRIFRIGDRVIQKRNNYDLEVFNGDIGKIIDLDLERMQCHVRFGVKKDIRDVIYSKENLIELDLAYAITIHKSQGSEFDVAIIPLMTQHFKMLHRNLIYTGLTRAKKMAIFIGSRRALSMAVRNQDSATRQTGLREILLDHSITM